MKMLGASAAALILSAAFALPALAESPGVATGWSSGSGARPGHPGSPGGFVGWSKGDRWDRGDRGNYCRGRGRCRRDRDGYGYGFDNLGSGYGGMIAGGEPGFFVQSGDAPEVVNGHAQYDYDRGYPYEYYRGRHDVGGEESPAMGSGWTVYAPMGGSRCEAESTRDRRTGERVSVRICRN